MTFEAYLTELADSSRPLVMSRLCNLSQPSPEEVRLFERAWPTIEVARRRQVLQCLADLAEDNVELNFDDVFQIALRDADAEVRRQAIEGLWECQERSLIDPLIALLRDDPAESVRAAAATALGRFVMLAELEELRPADAARVESALFSIIDDQEQPLEVRRRSVEAIGARTQERVTAIIRESYQSPSLRLRVSAIHAMGRNCDPQWLPILLQELRNPDPEMRFEAANACRELEDERAAPHLIPLIEDADPQVQLSAIAALGSIGGSLAKEKLQECLHHTDDQVRDAAQEALEELELGEEPSSFRMEGFP